MDLQTAITVLRAHYGTHVAAAKALGFSVRGYRYLRQRKESTQRASENFIILKAQALAGPEQ